MDHYYKRARAWVLAHKIWSAVIAIIIVYGGYQIFFAGGGSASTPKYVTATVSSSTVVATISESGQVSGTTQVDLPAKAGGEVFSASIAPGTHVVAGTAIASVDPTTELQAVATAKSDLQAAQIALAKLQEAADPVTLTDDQNAVANAQAALTKAHETGYDDVAAAFLDFPTAISSVDTMLHSSTVPSHTYEQNENAYNDLVLNYDASVTGYESAAESSYQKAYASYQQALADFKATPRTATNAQIEAIVNESYKAGADLSDALKATDNYFNFVSTTLTNHQQQVPSVLTTALNSLNTTSSQTNAHVATLSADVSAFTTDQRSLDAANATLSKLQGGADPLDIQSAQLSVQQKQDALTAAEVNLGDTVIRAPFDGIVAKVDVQKFQTIGANTVVATMASDHQSVNISLNEVDAAKLLVGQKATLTFDALPDITISGTVSSVDSLGTVTQGVVSYNAIIVFDTPNASVKPGMSVSASIVTGTASGLAVPASAVKTQGGQSYVQVFNPPLVVGSSTAGTASLIPPTRVPVTVGLSSDTQVIITSGLSVGDQIVTRTTTSGSASTAAPSLFSAVGGRAGGAGGARSGGGGGGNVRIGG